ncbi:hypothetical protein ACN28E_14820 [Archangium lansingense]|uniref:hypothetical protein n=1 Tax=Archangium lansingense TaxID=2995310 RepID=UPI003B7D6BE7
MSTRRIAPPPLGPPVLVALTLLAGCTGVSPHVPSYYAQTTDSATNGCLRNPACYTTRPGEEAVIPWLSRAVDAARTATTVEMVLQDAEIKLVEQTLVQCAQAANEQVNKEDEELRGREPTAEQCRQVVRREGNTEVTRAMDLGARKHKLALDCVRAAFAERFSENVSVEPTYQKESSTGLWRWIDPVQVAEWLKLGLKSQLWGSLVPDLVLHASRNPNQIQRVYDFKFPCPSDKRPSWRPYSKGHPHHPKDQKEMYEEALLGGKGQPGAVTINGIK